jgi:glycosyltransferase involved in cell wall biosynthesis
MIHTHRFKENILGAIAGRVRGTPSIRTVHGSPEPELADGGVRRRVIDKVDLWVAKSLQRATVAVSDDLGRQLSKSLRGADVRTIRNGIRVEEIRHKAREGGSPLLPGICGAKKVAIIGRLVTVKRVDLFIDAASDLIARNPERFEFYVAGEGPLRSHLEQHALEVGIHNRVHFLGFRPNPAALLAQMDVLALTSDHEGTPMVILEALALGIPVVARAVGGVPEMLGSASGCTLVPSSNSNDIATAIEETLVETRNGRPSFPMNYDIRECAAQYERLYRELVAISAR